MAWGRGEKGSPVRAVDGLAAREEGRRVADGGYGTPGVLAVSTPCVSPLKKDV